MQTTVTVVWQREVPSPHPLCCVALGLREGEKERERGKRRERREEKKRVKIGVKERVRTFQNNKHKKRAFTRQGDVNGQVSRRMGIL